MNEELKNKVIELLSEIFFWRARVAAVCEEDFNLVEVKVNEEFPSVKVREILLELKPESGEVGNANG